MSQSHGNTLWREPAGSGATPVVTFARFVLVTTGIYEIRTSGALAASLVSDGVGGYDLSDSNLTGVGAIAVLSSLPSVGIIF